MTEPLSGSFALHRVAAREHLRRGELDHAEQSFLRLLSVAPEDAEAALFVARRHFGRGEHTRAIELLRVAERPRPDDSTILQQLGAALLANGDFVDAAEKFHAALKKEPTMFVARLQLGIALEQAGESHDALINYSMAIRKAQENGRWLNDETTAPGLRDVVLYAIRYVNEGRKHLFQSAIEPLRHRYGASELRRVEKSLAIYLAEIPANIPDSRQQPKFLYFPDIPSRPYYSRDRFPWIAALEAGTGSIREEVLSVLSHANSLESFLQTDSHQDASELLQSSNDQAPAWDAYFFHRHGERFGDHCLKCPQTAALLDTLPLAYVREHSPETLFSVLSPGTHILPHRGVTNTRLVTHLPLIVPPNCALRVGGETHVWEEGRCVTFDDTFEHEAWNNSKETRVVLIVDSWNPDLSEAERAAVADLVGAIGDFNRACESPAPI